ncbi:MAG: alanine racemase [Promethearchaeota archaeon]
MPEQQTGDLITPSALIDLERMERNISSMAKRAKDGGVSLRPHIKTHKCIEIGRRQKKAGAKGITVSTLGEASAFADSNFSDITYAVPLAPNKFESVRKISEKTNLSVLVDHPFTSEKLGAFCKEEGFCLDVMVKIDCGYHRCGVDPDSPMAVSLVRRINGDPHLNFKGILTHAGHAYDATSIDEIKAIAKHEQNVMIKFAKTLSAESRELAPEVVSIGATPTTILADTIQEGITEIRPGNYVFFDYMQVALGTCEVSDCALTVLSRVISRNKERIVIDAGATALSKDRGPIQFNPNPGYGRILKDYDGRILEDGVIISSLSQEHGKLIVTDDTDLHLEYGDEVRILPNHSCLTANLFDSYNVVKGNSIVERWKIRRERLE